MPRKIVKPEEKPQRERFIETARTIGAEESAESFELVFKQVVEPPLLKQDVSRPIRKRIV